MFGDARGLPPIGGKSGQGNKPNQPKNKQNKHKQHTTQEPGFYNKKYMPNNCLECGKEREGIKGAIISVEGNQTQASVARLTAMCPECMETINRRHNGIYPFELPKEPEPAPKVVVCKGQGE
jgi:endogenous inhibitor of DNA gyrase (YacG/DUF329 family)